MSEPNEELETLRRVNAELTQKSATRKQKIADLETANAALVAKLLAEKVDAPLKAMCQELSTVPEIFQEQLLKTFKVELVDGTLTLLTSEGKPVTNKEGKSVPFERDALSKFLIEGNDARAKTFQAITITSRASGSGNSKHQISVKAESKSYQFGLR